MNEPNISLTYNQILSPISESLADVEKVLLKNLESDIPLLTEVSQYILKSGGKRFRPALLLLASGITGKIDDRACTVAAVVEYIHTATLLHDDVVDNADLRRSQKAARSIWGNEASVLVGDYLFTVSFQYLAEFQDTELIKTLAHGTTMMARGEIIQLERNNESATEEEYLQIIHYKTASLIGTAMSMGAMINKASKSEQEALYETGINIGMAFQMIDDALDYDIKNAKTGKEHGTDLKERKITLPLSHLIENADEQDRQQVLQILKGEEILDEHVTTVCELMEQTGSISYTLERAKQYSEMAKACLKPFPESAYKTSIEQLADFIISRKS